MLFFLSFGLHKHSLSPYLLYNLIQKNADGQSMLASTLIPQPYSMNYAPLEEDVNMSFGRFVLLLML